ncbi:Ribosomal protein L10 [Methanonatronarchaeum thermophilum]|uniref:Large ribosomal subunit protein uL10 n=1 Tax=Methanonatronarchaeum thermophilum TaxID=1927129 RepID=A0A1Y3GGF8_9EURY|nr:50S ribosomal protein L10 [Methanonatronarchaeum thermophilum]OUJ18535.1 Ribosomal protein L10 [Methanonatronarchaeum thermophilum]
MSSKVAEWKVNEVSNLSTKIDNSEAVGIVDIGGIPARQLQEMRSNLRGKADLRVSRNTLIEISLDTAEKENIKELKEYLEGQTSLVFSDINPFKLYNMLEESKTTAPASAGDIAQKDIVVEEGPTSLEPGPVLSDLQQAGLPAGIDGGDVVIQNTTTIVEKGEEINAKVADVLSKLDIEPMEVGLKLRAVVEEGTIFEPETLAIDIDKYREDITTAQSRALALAMGIQHPTEETIKPLIHKAYTEALAVGIEAEIFEPEVLKKLVAKANIDASTISSKIGEDFLPDED